MKISAYKLYIYTAFENSMPDSALYVMLSINSFDGTGNDTTTKVPRNDTNTAGKDTDTKLCGTEPCKDNSKKKSNNSTAVVVGSVIGAILFLAAIFFGIWIMRRRILRGT